MFHEEIRNLIFSFHPDETFYKQMYLAGENGEDGVRDFLSRYSAEEVRNRTLLVPDFKDHVILGEYGGCVREWQAFPDEQCVVGIHKHYRYSPQFEHSHEYIEILYVYEGNCINHINGTDLEMRMGDFCIIAPYTSHSISVFSDDVMILNILIREKTFQQDFFSIFSENDILGAFINQIFYSRENNSCITIAAGADMEIRDVIEEMYVETTYPQKFSYRMIEILCMKVFALILRSHEDRILPFFDKKDGGRQISAILRYMKENYQNIDLNEAAGHFHFSASYFSRKVKECTGKSFSRLLQDIRMEQACTLLINTDLRVSSICELVGYNNIEHFSRVFKDTFQLSPSAYRKELRLNMQ